MTEEDAEKSPVLQEVQRRRQLTERSGLWHDVITEAMFRDFRRLAGSWQEVYLWFNDPAEDAPLLHGRLVKIREKDWVIYGPSGFWAARRSHWTLVGVGLAG